MHRLLVAIIIGVALVSACTSGRTDPQPNTGTTRVVARPPLSGERLAYVVGCVNCHHQTPKDIINAPPLTMARSYSLPEFKTLLTTGVTRDGRDLYAQGSIMGIVAREQFSYLTGDEIAAIHEYLQNGWTAERAAIEEAKIVLFPPPTFLKK